MVLQETNGRVKIQGRLTNIWYRESLEARWCTGYSTVDYCTGEGNKEYRDQSEWHKFNRTRQCMARVDDVLMFGQSVRAIEGAEIGEMSCSKRWTGD
jgi:hypothetical protein